MDLEQFQTIVDVIEHCGGLMGLDVSLIQMGFKALFPNCPVGWKDILAVKDIFGPNLGALIGKTVWSKPWCISVSNAVLLSINPQAVQLCACCQGCYVCKQNSFLDYYFLIFEIWYREDAPKPTLIFS